MPLSLPDRMPEVIAHAGTEEMSDTLNKILGAIEDSKLTLQQDIGKVTAKLGLLHADHQKLTDKVQEVETARAHRVPVQRPQPGRLPLSFVAKLLHYRDRDLQLKRAHVAGPFMVEGGQAMVFPDFSAAVPHIQQILKKHGPGLNDIDQARLGPHNGKTKKRKRLRQFSAKNDGVFPERGFPARLTRPSATQSEEGKKLSLQAAASLTDPDLSDGRGARTDRDHDSDTHLSDLDSQASAPEDLS
ncbi:hypothetical protein NDU88_004444 [Pleurodeles waltl]|uniref:Uncharacterized protein n=1 Tax=Pleurodeles waltl TaxID=8319 RepID=A0AAV7PCS9_PLEWA|nr:hypothetical protein NDU88_004444 [Pleurodeles waltl]